MPDGQVHDEKRSTKLRSVPVEIRVSVGHAHPTVAELLALEQDSVLPLDKRIEDRVELFIGDRLIALGELVEEEGPTGGQLAVRLTDIVDTGDAG